MAAAHTGPPGRRFELVFLGPGLRIRQISQTGLGRAHAAPHRAAYRGAARALRRRLALEPRGFGGAGTAKGAALGGAERQRRAAETALGRQRERGRTALARRRGNARVTFVARVSGRNCRASRPASAALHAQHPLAPEVSLRSEPVMRATAQRDVLRAVWTAEREGMLVMKLDGVRCAAAHTARVRKRAAPAIAPPDLAPNVGGNVP